MTACTSSADTDLDSQIETLRAELALAETGLWSIPTGETRFEQRLQQYQQGWRQLEEKLARRPVDNRHHFYIIIPVADRPVHL